MEKDVINPLNGEVQNKPISPETVSNSPSYCLKGADLLSQKIKDSQEHNSQMRTEETSGPESDAAPKSKSFFKKHFLAYISVILVIALAVSSFFAVSFYIELKSAEKTIFTYESEFSDALEMYKDLKYAVDQKMERRYELIHDSFPDITRAKFEDIKAIFSEQGNRRYTTNRLKTLGYNSTKASYIYSKWCDN